MKDKTPLLPLSSNPNNSPAISPRRKRKSVCTPLTEASLSGGGGRKEQQVPDSADKKKTRLGRNKKAESSPTKRKSAENRPNGSGLRSQQALPSNQVTQKKKSNLETMGFFRSKPSIPQAAAPARKPAAPPLRFASLLRAKLLLCEHGATVAMVGIRRPSTPAPFARPLSHTRGSDETVVKPTPVSLGNTSSFLSSLIDGLSISGNSKKAGSTARVTHK